MSYKDNKTNKDSQKCKYFNDFFFSIFFKSNTINMKNSYEKQKFNKVNIDERKIKEILIKLHTNKACGPDNVGNTILKNLPTLSKSLHIVFQAALNKGYFPAYWEKSKVIPIFKDENRAMIEQYRLISLLCNVSNVLEKFVFNEIYEIVKPHLDNSQHGFRRHRSVVIQLLLFLDLLYNELDGNESEFYVETISYKDNKTNEDSQKCNYFNDFFFNIFLKSNTIKIKNSYEKPKFNEVYIDERKIKETLTKL